MRARNSITNSRSWQLEQFAHRNRFALTSSEARLWSALSARKLGVQFRRQVVLADRFIVDFLASSVHLVVEVDGGYHVLRRHADARRDQRLQRLGYRVLRVQAELVMTDLAKAIALVRGAL